MRHIEAQRIANALNDAPQMLTTEEVARLLHIDAATVIRWTKEDRFLSIKVGPGLHRFPKGSLEKYLRKTALSNASN